MAELQIQPAGEVIPRLTGIIWGPAKCGKTTFLMTAPGKKLLVNVDPDGYTSISSRKDVSIIDLAQYDPSEIVSFGEKKVPALIKATEDFGPGDTVVIDSLSSYGWAAMLTAIKNNVGESNKFKPTIEAPGQSAYGARTNYIISMVRNILKVTAQRGMHCWFTAHMDTPTTDDKGNFLYQSMTLSDKGTNQTSLAISEIWFMDRNDGKSVLAIQPCRGRKPMGSRMFVQDKGEQEFTLKYDITKPDTQPHSISTWYTKWLANDRNKLELPT